MGRSSRDKGAQFERDVQNMARAHGFTSCRRAFASGAQGGADLTGIPGVALECKRQERVELPKWWRQTVEGADAGETPVLALRWSRGPALAVLELDELLSLLALREAADYRANVADGADGIYTDGLHDAWRLTERRAKRDDLIKPESGSSEPR